jgi:hypothetical protein
MIVMLLLLSAVQTATGPNDNPTAPNPAWNSLGNIKSFGPWGVTSNCKVCAGESSTAGFKGQQQQQQQQQHPTAAAALLRSPSLLYAHWQCQEAIGPVTQKASKLMATYPPRCPESANCCCCCCCCCCASLQYVCKDGAWPCEPGDQWPYGMCSLKKITNPVKPKFWSSNAGRPLPGSLRGGLPSTWEQRLLMPHCATSSWRLPRLR